MINSMKYEYDDFNITLVNVRAESLMNADGSEDNSKETSKFVKKLLDSYQFEL